MLDYDCPVMCCSCLCILQRVMVGAARHQAVPCKKVQFPSPRANASASPVLQLTKNSIFYNRLISAVMCRYSWLLAYHMDDNV